MGPVALELLGARKSAAGDSQFSEHFVSAAWSLFPGVGPNSAVLNFVEDDR